MIDLVAFISYAAGSFRTNAFGINDAFVDRRSLCMQHNKQTTCLDGGRICVAESALLTIEIQQMLVENKRFYYFCSFSIKKNQNYSFHPIRSKCILYINFIETTEPVRPFTVVDLRSISRLQLLNYFLASD